MVTLYGKGAIQIHDGKYTYTPVDGRLVIPDHLVAKLPPGWNRYPPPPPEPETPPAIVPAPVSAAVAQVAPLNLTQLHEAIWSVNRLLASVVAEALTAPMRPAEAPAIPVPPFATDRVTDAVERLNMAVLEHLTAPEGGE